MTHPPTTLRLILGDQLSPDLSALRDIDATTDIVLMAEVREEATYVPHHRQKIVLILAAMRHFGAALRMRGFRVDYIPLDDPANTGSFTGEIERAIRRHRPDRIVVTEPGEWRVLTMIGTWSARFGLPVEIREDDRFLCSHARFAQWSKGRREWRMEFFYREMRRETGLLMENGQPVGGRWNFDPENRKRLPPGLRLPSRLRPAPDATTRQVITLVERFDPNGFGALDDFAWPVTREQALAALDHFVRDCLPLFGDYQDAMRSDTPFTAHSLLSAALNIGLLSPREVCDAAETAWRQGHAPLNAAEGFIRQVLGWREYIRGIYWDRMPAYAESNALDATAPLPEFYWTAETDMRCIGQVVSQTRRHGYAHHIQRLMVTGNFALLAGIAPAAIEAWYLAVYVDAFDWVELPNTHGMAIFADGGLLASKPYAASGAYINRMSDYCGGCRYDPRSRTGPDACPFTVLYWAFLIRHRPRLGRNPRMAMPYRHVDAMTAAQQAAIIDHASALLAAITPPLSAAAGRHS